MNRWRSLSAQFAAAASLIALVVVAIAGAGIALGIDQRDRAALDAELSERLSRVQTDLPKMLGDSQPDEGGGTDDAYGGLLAGSDSTVRLVQNGAVIASRGATVDAPAPETEGYGGATVDGVPWRSYVVDTGDGVLLQALQSLAPFRARLLTNTVLVAAVTVGAAALAALTGWLLGRRLVRPLQQLRDGAVALNTDLDSGARLPRPSRLLEVSDLATAFDALIDRLHSSARSARRFAADAGHELRTPAASVGAYLEILTRPELEPEQRIVTAQVARAEHARLTALLEGLQTLARGDAGALPSREPVSLTDTVASAATAARRAHREAHIDMEASDTDVIVNGWADGIRRAVDNLIENAATHGDAAGHILIRVEADAPVARVVVDDDGPGIPLDQRQHVMERFVRGPSATAPGSGLGLAIAAQQVALHNGRLTLTDNPKGGLRAVIELPLD